MALELIQGKQIATASWALRAVTASYALTASYLEGYISPFPFTGSAQITGSLGVTGSVTITNALTSSDLRATTTITSPIISYSSILGTSGGEMRLSQSTIRLNSSSTIQWADTADSNDTRSIGLRRYATGTLEVYDGTTNTGLEVDRRDLLARTLSGSSLYISGSSTMSGSLNITQGITGSLFGTSSYAVSSSFARNSTSASYSVSSSYTENAATASNILGGKAPHIPYFITDTTLATSSLYQSGSTSVIINQDNNTTANPEALYVWQPHPTSINVISGKGNLNNYLQLNIQNTNQGTNASSDIVATADNGNETINYIDMGINSENYNSGFIGNANDAYLYSTGKHLHIGNASNEPVMIFAGGSDVDIHNKLKLNPNNQHEVTGSLEIDENLTVLGGITGSLFGNATTATTATNATSASHAIVADSAIFANTAGNGGVTNIVAGSGIVLPFGGTGAVTIVSSGGGGVTIISGSAITSSFTNLDTWTFNHNLGTRTPTITVFDSDYNQIIPQNIQLVSTSSAVITFPTQESGFAIASTGGTTGTALSSSYSLFATYAESASYYPETDPIFTAKSGSFATTGSNRFIGNQTITGSVFINSGSSLNLNGNTLYSSASTIFTNANIVPTQHNVQSLGTTTERWKDVWIGSGTIYIADSVIPNSDLAIESINDILTISGSAGLEVGSFKFLDNELFLKNEAIPIIIGSGSSTAPVQLNRPLEVISGQTGNVSFEVLRDGHVSVYTPVLGVNDPGAFSVIGSSDGYAQTIGLAGRMIHVTGNDGLPSRIENDAFGTGAFAAYIGRSARGIASSPSASQNGDILSRLAGLGYGDTGYLATNINSGPPINSIDFVAKQNYNDNSASSAIQFFTSPQDARVRTLSATVDTTGITIPSSSLLFGTASWALNAQTASYAANGGVTQILAGANITLSPTNGLGQVTITAATPGGAGGNSLTSSYGAFYSTLQQTNPVANTPNSMSFNTTYLSNGVSISGSTNTKIKVDQPGAYNLSFTAQIDRTDDAVKPTIPVTIWLRKNGSDLAYTAVAETVDIKSTNYVAAWNYMLSAAANDYYEIMWKSDYTTIALTPTAGAPLGPSVSATVSRVDLASSNTGSFTGSFTGTLIGTASYATTASYALNGGVTQIIAGNNITITNGGSGSVTINAATSGSNVATGSFATTGSNTFIGNQIITGSLTLNSGSALNLNDGFYVNGNKQFNYGQFINTTTQSGSLNVSASFTYTDTVYSNGVTLVSGSRLTVQNSGVYKIDVTAKVTSGGVASTYTWLKKNGTNIPNTAFHIDVSIKNYLYGITPTYIASASAGDYFEVVRQFDIAGTTYPDGTATGNIPGSPSIITTVTQIA